MAYIRSLCQDTFKRLLEVEPLETLEWALALPPSVPNSWRVVLGPGGELRECLRSWLNNVVTKIIDSNKGMQLLAS